MSNILTDEQAMQYAFEMAKYLEQAESVYVQKALNHAVGISIDKHGRGTFPVSFLNVVMNGIVFYAAVSAAKYASQVYAGAKNSNLTDLTQEQGRDQWLGDLCEQFREIFGEKYDEMIQDLSQMQDGPCAKVVVDE